MIDTSTDTVKALMNKLAVALDALEELARDPRENNGRVLSDGWTYYTDAVNYARAAIAQIKEINHG